MSRVCMLCYVTETVVMNINRANFCYVLQDSPKQHMIVLQFCIEEV